jgi:hypothetical protein
MRLILDVPFDTPSAEMFKTLNWMSIEHRCLYNASNQPTPLPHPISISLTSIPIELVLLPEMN